MSAEARKKTCYDSLGRDGCCRLDEALGTWHCPLWSTVYLAVGVCWVSKGRPVSWVKEELVSWSGKPVPPV